MIKTLIKSEFSFYFKKMLRRAGIVKGMVTDPLYVKKKEKTFKINKKQLLTKITQVNLNKII